jgi:hypothetical protein
VKSSAGASAGKNMSRKLLGIAIVFGRIFHSAERLSAFSEALRSAARDYF